MALQHPCVTPDEPQCNNLTSTPRSLQGKFKFICSMVVYLSFTVSSLAFIERTKCYQQLLDAHRLAVSKLEVLTGQDKKPLCVAG